MQNAKERGPLDLGWEGTLGMFLGFFVGVSAFAGVLYAEPDAEGMFGVAVVIMLIVWTFSSATIAWLLQMAARKLFGNTQR